MVKEIHKSQVCCVKNKTFIIFALEKKEINYSYSNTDKEKLSSSANILLLSESKAISC